MDAKFDVRRDFKELYAPKNKTFELLTVPRMTYIAIDGEGAPESTNFSEATQAIYSTAYPLKFMSKKDQGRDYAVPPLEGLWWADDPAVYVSGQRDKWKWTLLSHVPDWIIPDHVEVIKERAFNKGITAANKIELRSFAEGLSFQMLFIGPYADEAPVLAELHDLIMPSEGYTFNGAHHEIYLSDPRRTAPEKLKTILRQPVRSITT